MKPSNTLLVVIVVGGVLGGLLMWETVGPSTLCGGCYRDNAPGCPVTPCPGRELLVVETSTVNSSTNVTLNTMNTGDMGISLDKYNVKDPAGHQYTSMNWTVQTTTRNNQFTFSLEV